jgi:hypothetical protein
MFRFYAPIIFGVTDGAIGAATGALTGAVGASILSAMGMPYDVAKAAELGAWGEGMLSACLSARSIKLVNCGFFHKSSQSVFSFRNAFLASAHLSLQVASGMLGCVMAQFLDDKDMMQKDISPIMALGAGVMLVPIWLMDSLLYKKISPPLQHASRQLKLLDSLTKEYGEDPQSVRSRI